MNEDDLKNALHGAMVASSPPPPMDSGAALDAAQRAHRRRKATWGAAVAGLAVVAIAVGTVLVPQFTGGGSGLQVAGSGSSVERPPVTTGPPSGPPSVTDVAPTATARPTSGMPPDTKAPWPDGQTDRTATSGPRADKSVRVLNDLGSSLPAGLEAVDKQPLGEGWYGPMRYTQSQFADYYDGDKQVWEYMGTTPVAMKGAPGLAKLWIQVDTKGNRLAGIGSPCEAVEAAWPVRGGTCQVRVVDGKEIGLVTATGADTDLDLLAIHKHEDGTLVFVGQAAEFRRSGHPALGKQPFTQDQLLALAADPRFHLD